MHLTYPDSDTHTGTVSTAKAEEAGAPETEIEITPEMIEAGAMILCRFHPGEDLEDEVACEIWRAMGAARRNPGSQS